MRNAFSHFHHSSRSIRPLHAGWLCLLLICLLPATGTACKDTALPDTPSAADSDDVRLRLLCIGNSFSLDGTIYLPQMMQDMEIPMRTYGIWCAMYASASLEYWWEHYQSGRDIEFFLQMGGSWVPPDSARSLREMLRQPWDVIVLQQTSTLSDTPDTYMPWLPRLIEAIRTECPNRDVTIAWHMTWSKSPTFHTGPYDMEGWQDITRAVQQALGSTGITTVIPTGTTIQNARQYPQLEQNLLITRDGMHLLYGIGHYMAAVTWYESVCAPFYGRSCLGTPPSATMRNIDSQRKPFVAITDDNYRLCQQCAKDALDNPYALTPPTGILAPPADDGDGASYRIDGRRWQGSPHGLYIRDHKKYIAK